MTTRVAVSVLVLLCAASARAQTAQQPTAATGSALALATLQQAAVDADPRLRQLTLQQQQTELRLANIDAERLPSIAAEGLAQHQTDVPTPPSLVPGGRPLFLPPKDIVDSYVRIDQRIVDPTSGPRRAVEQAQLAEAQSRVRVALYGLRQEVNDAFFAAALMQERANALAATIDGLEARLREATDRVTAGAALPADAAAIEATLLRRRQDLDELRANRAAALTRLSALTDRPLTTDVRLELPDLAPRVAQARRTAGGTRARPEYEQFARTRERLSRQQDAVSAQVQPRVSAFARLGYAKPGPNFIGNEFDTYGIVGLQVQWKPFTWGSEGREREALSVQAQIVAADEAAFARAIGRATDTDLQTIDRVTQALALDDRIVRLREEIDRSTEARFRESVVTASEYLDRGAELLDAQFARAAHRVELAQASARFLTTLGLEVR